MAFDPSSANEPLITHERRRKGLTFLTMAVAGAAVALAIQMGLNANFLAEDIGVSGFQMGLLESARETCGIVAFAVLALLAGLAEPIVGAIMLLILAVGISAYALIHDYVWILLVSLVWSQGLHVWMPLPRSMALALAEPGRAGFRTGQVEAAHAAGFGGGLFLALVLTWFEVPMRPMYVLAGGAALLAVVACLGIPRRIKTPGPRLVFRRRYGLYYLLSFLEGWRKQIFICFSAFLLVRIYGTPLQTILLLWLGVQIISYFAAPQVGKLIDRIGERKILVFYFGCLTLFFIGYALIRIPAILFVVFVVDNAFFVFHMALYTYVDKIAPKSEHTPTLSMGVAMNHVAAVTMPFLGGILWETLGYQWPFLIGAAAAAVSVLVALKVPPHHLLARQAGGLPVAPSSEETPA